MYSVDVPTSFAPTMRPTLLNVIFGEPLGARKSEYALEIAVMLSPENVVVYDTVSFDPSLITFPASPVDMTVKRPVTESPTSAIFVPVHVPAIASAVSMGAMVVDAIDDVVSPEGAASFGAQPAATAANRRRLAMPNRIRRTPQ